MSFLTLIDVYKAHGAEIRVGLNPFHWNKNENVPFALIRLPDGIVETGAGISIQEIHFFETLAQCFAPKSIFIIGNAFGWSTICLALLFPGARVVALDDLSEQADARRGFDLTKQIITSQRLNATVVEGHSPNAVPKTVLSELDGSVDLALVDGLHTNEQQIKDYLAIKPFLSPDCVAMFHDVLNFRMGRSFRQIAQDWHGPAQILTRTPSGMGALYTESLRATAGRAIDAFTDDVCRVDLEQETSPFWE